MTMPRLPLLQHVLLFWLLPWAAWASTEDNGVKECTIDCLHGTKCVKGKANFTWHPLKPGLGHEFDFSTEIDRDGYHCDCPPGLTGLRCGRTYENCDDGTHTCFNGGKCIEKLKDIYQNEQMYCDCPSVADANGTSKYYAGKYCEIEVEGKNNRCTEDNNICQNGGTCKKHVDELDPCHCPKDYVGRLCEFYEPSVPDCTLECKNGGSCRLGSKEEDLNLVLDQPDGSQQEQNVHVVHDGNYQYCECPHGFSGVKCEVEEAVCGNIKCKHGSKCVTLEDKDTGETTHHCDCADINKKLLDKGEDLQYSGRHCEVASTNVCHFTDGGVAFCANHGKCPASKHGDCNCPDGFHGAHCQFKDEEKEEDYAKCELKCKNGGTCREGTIQDQHTQDLIRKYGSDLGSMMLNVTHNNKFEHCACPDGYVGLECEYSMKSCGEDGADHPCFHGATCTMVNNIPTCVCEDSIAQVAGLYCQHLAENVCTPGLDKVDPSEELDPNRGFCVNGGACVTNKDGEAACRCHSQFEGPHCEYSKEEAKLSATNGGGSSKAGGVSGVGKFAVFLAVLICLGAIGFGFVVYKRKKVLTEDCAPVYPDLDNTLAMDDQSLRSAPVVDVGPEKDFDGNELKDVEFI